MKIPKDLLLYLTKYLDNVTIINLLSVNKKFNNEEYYRIVMTNKYYKLSKLKNETSWKIFFKKMVYHIDKLEKEFDFPYIPGPHFDPEQFYKHFTSDIWNNGLFEAAQSGRLDLIKFMIDKGAYHFTLASVSASEFNHLHIVKYLIDNFNIHKDDIYFLLLGACRGGSIKLVKYLIELNKDIKLDAKLNKLIDRASEFKNTEIVNYLTSLLEKLEN